MYVHVFSHYADKNGPQPRVLYIAVSTVVSGVLLLVAIVTTVAIVVCCKKCIRTKGNRFKRLSPSTAVMDPKNVIAKGTGEQETQIHNNVRKNRTVYSNVYFICVY